MAILLIMSYLIGAAVGVGSYIIGGGVLPSILVAYGASTLLSLCVFLGKLRWP